MAIFTTVKNLDAELSPQSQGDSNSFKTLLSALELKGFHCFDLHRVKLQYRQNINNNNNNI